MTTTIALTAGQVMDRAAAIMNDAAKRTYTYAVQYPYLNMALQDLQEHYEQNEIPVTATRSAVITIPSGTSSLAFATSGNPRLPDDLIEPSVLWERTSGIDPYTLMTRVNVLDLGLAGSEIGQFIWYVWENNEIRFFAANTDIDIKMDYTKNLFGTVASDATVIPITNGIGYLANRTARHLSFFIAENPTRGNELDADATASLDRVLSIGTKGKQAIITRRRPFRAAYKRGSFF